MMYKKYASASFVILCLMLQPLVSSAQLNRQKPKNLQNVGIEEHLGETIPLDLTFATANGDSVTLASLMEEGKPILLNPVYYECPMLCSMVINAVFQGVKQVEWTPSEEYNIITFSFDPKENHKLAATVKDSIIQQFDHQGAQDGWYFLTGKQQAISRLTEAIGFKYKKLKKKDQFAHSAAIMFLSPQGVLTRYLYGIKYKPLDIRSALYEAADGKVGSTIDRIVLYCYAYNPNSNSYTPVARRIMKVGGALTLLVLIIFLGSLWFGKKLFNNDKKQTSNGSAQ